MRKWLLALLGVLVLTRPVWAADAVGTLTEVGKIGYIVMASYDGLQTTYCSAQHTCHEANVVYRWIVERDEGEHVVQAMAVKAGATAGIVLLIDRLKQRYPRRVMWTALGMFGGQTVVNVINARTMRKGRP